MLDDERENERLSLTAHRELAIDTVIAHVESREIAERLSRLGIQVVEPGVALLVTMEALAQNPHAFSVLTETEGAWHVKVARVSRRELGGRPLAALELPAEARVMIIARQGGITIPRGQSRLRVGDRLTLVGSKQAVEEAAEYLRG